MKFNIKTLIPVFFAIVQCTAQSEQAPSQQAAQSSQPATQPAIPLQPASQSASQPASQPATQPAIPLQPALNGTTPSSVQGTASQAAPQSTPSSPVVAQGISQGNQVIITEEQLDEFDGYGTPGFRLAIIGDSGAESRSKKVMELTTFDALLHLGDYDYSCKPDLYFDNMINDRKFQFMGIMGNHEDEAQCGAGIPQKYLNHLYDEMTDKKKNSEVECEFSSSKFMWSCKYKNLRVIGLSSGISKADDREEQLHFLKKHLGNAEEPWKICSWHYYDKYYHTGKYPSHSDKNIISGNGSDDESFYDYCKDQGAIIFSAHDHVYARTRVMSKFKEPVIDEYDGEEDGRIVQIRHGATLNILNGAGGWEMYIEQGKEKDYEHWQKKYAKGEHNENENRYGGLFCDFNYKGDVNKAHCRFLRTNSSNKTFDSFYIYRNEDPANQKYTQMDEVFRNEKIKAYKLAHNITDEATFVPGHDNDSEGDNNGASNFKSIKEKIFTTTNFIIGGSVCAALVVLGGGFFMFKRSRKVDVKDSELLSKTMKEKEANGLYNNGYNNYGPVGGSQYPQNYGGQSKTYGHDSDKYLQNLRTSNYSNGVSNASMSMRDTVPLVNHYQPQPQTHNQSFYSYNEENGRGRSQSQSQSQGQSRARSQSRGRIDNRAPSMKYVHNQNNNNNIQFSSMARPSMNNNSDYDNSQYYKYNKYQ